MEKSVFSKIIDGQLPCYKIYEDNLVLGFLDINPLTPGHTILVPKTQVDNIWELPDEFYFGIFKAAKLIAAKIKSELGYVRVGSMVEGFEIAHAHLHLIGLNDGFRATYASHQKIPATPEELNQMADKLSLL